MARSKSNFEVKSLYYITHIDNLNSILSQGILSHKAVEDSGMQYTAVYDKEIVSNRKMKYTPSGKSLWEYSNVYFQARNPMLYRVVLEKGAKDIAVIALYPQVLQSSGAYITDGNAANTMTDFYQYKDGIKVISGMWDTIQGEWWNSLDGSKRKIMAECLIPSVISPDSIHSIYVANYSNAEKVKALLTNREIPVIPEPTMFFYPAKQYQISKNLFLAEGDMFFSNMQTLTVSVNIVGIMGKGLASRAKYQFPDVYVVYQDACRKKWLKMGKPYLYKREASLDDELMDEPKEFESPNGNKWFLLFPTKKHWREDSDFNGIEEGLIWLKSNYKSEKIKSIAMPALGCGLGKLDWKDVGPMMCKHLSELDINVAIYLPREREIPKEFLSKDYLLSSKSS
jgi:O-acetyl-ADP-ribose deacetylase (regulator of RNase III)